MAEASATRAFLSGDPVEAMAFDSESKRLLVASHYGTIKMYSIEPNGTSDQLAYHITVANLTMY